METTKTTVQHNHSHKLELNRELQNRLKDISSRMARIEDRQGQILESLLEISVSLIKNGQGNR